MSYAPRKVGGRRHGLDESGVAVTAKITLGEVADAALGELSAASGLSRSAVVRTLVTDPGARDVIARSSAAVDGGTDG